MTTGGPFAQTTGLDNVPLDNLGGTADVLSLIHI